MRAATIVSLLLSLAASPALAQSVSIDLTTTEAGGNYAPRNVVSVWVEAADGTFVKTLGRWSNARTRHLVAWNTASGTDADAVSGATRSNHTTPLAVTWDLTDRGGVAVPMGLYTIRMELADRNSNTPAENNAGTFTFDHNGVSAGQADLANGGFTAVTIDYQAALDTDPPDGGPGGTGDECVDDDGLCPASCTASTDNDCEPVASNIEGGCQVGGRSGPMAPLGLVLLAIGFGFRRRPLFLRRRRRLKLQ